MDADFWHDRWEQRQLGFHEEEVNPALVDYFQELNLKQGSRVFVPLCGKTLDIAWLLAQDYQVVGVELSTIAIDELFDELGVKPDVDSSTDLKRYSAMNIDIWCGDIFHLSKDLLGTVDAIYDRAALVALPKAMRDRYTEQLVKITNAAPQLLVTLEYDQSQIDGPPFSVSEEEVRRQYADSYEITLLNRELVRLGLKGKVDVFDGVWLLQGR